MQASELYKYVENPHLLTEQSVKQLQKLTEDFPYFQLAHILLSMASKKWDASVYQQSLKKTAIVATNRSHLFDLIHLADRQPADLKSGAEQKQKTENAGSVNETAEQQGAQELNILKAAELSTEPVNTLPADPGSSAEPEEILEKEIHNRVVNSFIEKEVLKTPELHHPKTRNEAGSFAEWLSLMKKNNGQHLVKAEEDEPRKVRLKEKARIEEIPSQDPGAANSKKEKNRALIDKIIESSPGIIRAREDQKFFAAESRAKESLLENEHLVTETLARIYAMQGSVNKAIRAYEILSLKFPQKSAYFATLIQKLKLTNK